MPPTEARGEEQNRSLSVDASGSLIASLIDSLIVIARHKRFVARVTLGVGLLSVVIVCLLPNKYTAAAVVIPPSQSSSLSSALLSQIGGSGASALASLAGGSLGIKNTGEMYVAFFRSRTVEDAMIQRFALKSRYHAKTMADARKAFENRTKVALGVKDGLIHLSVEDKDPKLAADIANGYLDEFKKLSANLAITEASQRRLFFEQQLREAKDNLTNAEEAMKHTQQTTGVLQVDSQAKALIETAVGLRAQAVAKEVQIQAMRSYATEDNPELVATKQQLAAIKAQLSSINGTRQDSASDLILPKGKIPEAGMQYLRSLRDLKYYEAIFELLAKQFEVAKLDEARQGAVIQVADYAVPPDKKSSPMRTVIVLLSMIGAFVFSIFWSFAVENWKQTCQEPEQYRKIQYLRELFFEKQNIIE